MKPSSFVIDITLTTGYMGRMNWDECYQKSQVLWDNGPWRLLFGVPSDSNRFIVGWGAPFLLPWCVRFAEMRWQGYESLTKRRVRRVACGLGVSGTPAVLSLTLPGPS